MTKIMSVCFKILINIIACKPCYMKYTPFLFLLFFLAAISCKKDRLTKETQKGANTFSCLIDGKVYKPCSHRGIIGGPNDPSLNGGVYSSGNGMSASVSAAGCGESGAWDKNVYIEIGNLTGAGTYLLSDLSNRLQYTVRENNTIRVYSSLNTKSGRVIITRDDRASKILSGTFEFEGSDNNDPGKIIKITSGRFDIKYQ